VEASTFILVRPKELYQPVKDLIVGLIGVIVL